MSNSYVDASADPHIFLLARRRMVEEQLHSRGISDQRVLEAMLCVPRHLFVAKEYQEQAHEDHPLPIGEGQTISQPFIVASMLEALELKGTENVLEVGTGSGYVTALLAELTCRVLSIERRPALAQNALEILTGMAYRNFEIIIGDGSLGLPQQQPFDAIIVSAAPVEMPAPLLAQLAEGGRMIIPVGATEAQQLQLIRKKNGRFETTLREPCRFVPLIVG